MRDLFFITPPSGSKAQAGLPKDGSVEKVLQIRKEVTLTESHEIPDSGAVWGTRSSSPRSWAFFRKLSNAAIREFESIAAGYSYDSAKVLFSEGEEPLGIFVLLEGRANLFANADNGRRLNIGFAEPGDLLGLSSAVSGCPYELTALTELRCRILVVPRSNFINFLERYPVACQNAAQQLSLEYQRAWKKIGAERSAIAAPAKLAQLLLEWCEDGEAAGRGTGTRGYLSLREIVDCICLSRSQVTELLNEFRDQGLVELHGSDLIIPSRSALAVFAGAGRIPDLIELPHEGQTRRAETRCRVQCIGPIDAA